jgi:hypothetical protein
LRNFAAKNFPTVEETVKVKVPSRARGIVHGESALALMSLVGLFVNIDGLRHLLQLPRPSESVLNLRRKKSARAAVCGYAMRFQPVGDRLIVIRRVRRPNFEHAEPEKHLFFHLSISPV